MLGSYYSEESYEIPITEHDTFIHSNSDSNRIFDLQAYVEAVEDSKAVATLSSSATNCNHELQRLVDTGLNLGGFLCEAGRYQEAHLVYQVPLPLECSRDCLFRVQN
jgi:hypothetical protein